MPHLRPVASENTVQEINEALYDLQDSRYRAEHAVKESLHGADNGAGQDVDEPFQDGPKEVDQVFREVKNATDSAAKLAENRLQLVKRPLEQWNQFRHDPVFNEYHERL